MESQLVHAGVQKRAWMQRRQALDLEVHSSKKLEVSFWLDDADGCSCERCGLSGEDREPPSQQRRVMMWLHNLDAVVKVAPTPPQG